MIPLMKNAFLSETETKKALADFIIKSDRLSMGEKCVEFEKAFAEKQNRTEAILFNSGGSANLAILQSLKNMGLLKTGDKMGFSALTWSTNVMPIIQMGLEPVPVDCELETLNVSSAKILERLNTTPLQALFITNVLGFAGDLDNIRRICAEKNIILIEDNCESLGTELSSGKAGNFGLASSFSFFVAHHMSTIEGGMVCTDDEHLAQMLRIVRANGWDRNLASHHQKKWREKHNITSELYSKYAFYDLGFNLRPTEITGFLGLLQLDLLDDSLVVRENNYLRMESALLKNPDLLPLKRGHLTKFPAFAMPFICKDRAAFQKYTNRFQEKKIEIRPIIAGNMQEQPFYKKYVATMHALPNTEFIHDHGFYCGNCPDYADHEIKTITDCLTVL
jgi:CDP-6-deoxy-D-xylo-4-hexulose-3-dehydrase